MIHSSVIIHSSCTIHSSVEIEPYSVIGPNVTIGKGTRIGVGSVIGGPPEHKDFYKNYKHGVTVGENVFISNGVTIDSGCYKNTKIGNNVWMLRQSHAGHDSEIEDDCIISCSTLVGGHAVIMKGCNLGLGTKIHQHKIVPPYLMAGMGCVINKKSKLDPFSIYVGNPAKFLKVNTIAVERFGLREEQMKELHERYLKRISD